MLHGIFFSDSTSVLTDPVMQSATIVRVMLSFVTLHKYLPNCAASFIYNGYYPASSYASAVLAVVIMSVRLSVRHTRGL